MSENIAIMAENLTKIYKLYNSPLERLKESILPFSRKYHHDFYAVNNVSFEIKKGDSVGVIGKNGSGKSTLLKLITGVLTPSKGNVVINGNIAALLELGTGFNPELTGIENVYFNGTLMGYTRQQMDDRLDSILSFADIGEFVYQPVKTYSSGMFVRLAFAVAVNVSPDILVIDEALSVGDMRFQKRCKDKIQERKDDGTTIILVSHAMADIRATCSSVLYMDGGKCQCYSDVSEGISNYYYNINSYDVGRIDSNNIPSCINGDIGGTGDILIKNVKCYQRGKDSKCSDIEYGKNIIIEFEYFASQKIEKPIFRINFSIAGYKYFVNFDSNECLDIYDVIGCGTIFVEIVNPNLYPQAYTINIGVISEITNAKYFYWSDAAKFVIVSPPKQPLLHPTSIIKLDFKCSAKRTSNE